MPFWLNGLMSDFYEHVVTKCEAEKKVYWTARSVFEFHFAVRRLQDWCMLVRQPTGLLCTTTEFEKAHAARTRPLHTRPARAA